MAIGGLPGCAVGSETLDEPEEAAEVGSFSGRPLHLKTLPHSGSKHLNIDQEAGHRVPSTSASSLSDLATLNTGKHTEQGVGARL